MVNNNALTLSKIDIDRPKEFFYEILYRCIIPLLRIIEMMTMIFNLGEVGAEELGHGETTDAVLTEDLEIKEGKRHV